MLLSAHLAAAKVSLDCRLMKKRWPMQIRRFFYPLPDLAATGYR
jgi:hypothetical protein